MSLYRWSVVDAKLSSSRRVARSIRARVCDVDARPPTKAPMFASQMSATTPATRRSTSPWLAAAQGAGQQVFDCRGCFVQSGRGGAVHYAEGFRHGFGEQRVALPALVQIAGELFQCCWGGPAVAVQSRAARSR